MKLGRFARYQKYYNWYWSTTTKKNQTTTINHHQDDNNHHNNQIILLEHELRTRYNIHQLHLDDETKRFIKEMWPMPFWRYWVKNSIIKSHRNLFSRRVGMSDQDAFAFVGGNPMYVLSSKQINELLSLTNNNATTNTNSSSTTKTTKKLLDIGSGDGEVVQRFAHTNQFKDITCVEVSKGMRILLSRRKRKQQQQPLCDHVMDELPSPQQQQQYDLITMFNVLDRVHDPTNLLNTIKPLLTTGTGKLLLAQITPYKPSVATTTGWEQGRKPFRALLSTTTQHAEGTSKRIKEDAYIWTTKILEPNGWVVESISKVPYLSRSHVYSKHKFAILQDFIFLLSLNNTKK